MKWTILVAAAIAGCGKDSGSAEPSKSTKEPGRAVVGIWPEDWDCERIGTVAEIGQVLGGTVRVSGTPMTPGPGLPMPCNFVFNGANGEEAWTFDLDCRDGYKVRADALFAQYTERSAEMVTQDNAASAAAPAAVPAPKRRSADEQVDAGPPRRAPEGAFDVAVGARGLDHHGQGLLFIDDDAPCYVRVVGPDADRRLALARHVADRLNLANAPMTPRNAP
jgi:hypothetical protein